MPPIRIHHPMKDADKDESNVPANLAAFGLADDSVNGVAGVLVRDKDSRTVPGTTLVQMALDAGLFWVIAFSSKDGIAPHPTDTWHLLVWDPSDRSTKAAFSGITVRESPWNVQIEYPKSANNPICQNFAAYGSAMPATDVEGSIDGGSTWVEDSQPPLNWVIPFTGVPVGNGYTLTVRNSGNWADKLGSSGLNVASKCT